jgi:hypothetical protein
MSSRNLAGRIVKLEEARSRSPRHPSVYHVSEPPTAGELAAIDVATAAGYRFCIMPWPCKTVDEWVARYGVKELVQ